jgi:hypothetical protein
VLHEIQEKLLPYCTQVGHPGYMGLITPSPNPVGVVADFICSALNQNIGAYSIGPAGVAIERRTVRWLTDLVGYGPEALPSTFLPCSPQPALCYRPLLTLLPNLSIRKVTPLEPRTPFPKAS